MTSLQKYKKGIFLMIISSCLVCVGQLFWKLFSVEGVGQQKLVCLIIGFILYGFGAIIMVIAYRYGKLSVLQPILSLNYVITIILAAVILRETITMGKIVGVACIIAGVTLVSRGGNE